MRAKVKSLSAALAKIFSEMALAFAKIFRAAANFTNFRTLDDLVMELTAWIAESRSGESFGASAIAHALALFSIHLSSIEVLRLRFNGQPFVIVSFSCLATRRIEPSCMKFFSA